MSKRKVHAEIEYFKENGESIHSDICPPECSSYNVNDPYWRKLLHDCLDEWLDKSRGTKGFYVCEESYMIAGREEIPALKIETEMMLLSIERDFSDCPGHRYIKDGNHSGELFRDTILVVYIEKALSRKLKLLIDLDGTYGMCPGFLEETFGGLIREKGYSKETLTNLIIFKSQESKYNIEDILGYWDDAENAKGDL